MNIFQFLKKVDVLIAHCAEYTTKEQKKSGSTKKLILKRTFKTEFMKIQSVLVISFKDVLGVKVHDYTPEYEQVERFFAQKVE